MKPEGRINVASRAAGFEARGARKALTKLTVPLIVALGVAVGVKFTGEPVSPEMDADAV